ncbi:MAG: hypothetical protein H7831_18860, partial [Magnetococcus sp. WYHC-3]
PTAPLDHLVLAPVALVEAFVAWRDETSPPGAWHLYDVERVSAALELLTPPADGNLELLGGRLLMHKRRESGHYPLPSTPRGHWWQRTPLALPRPPAAPPQDAPASPPPATTDEPGVIKWDGPPPHPVSAATGGNARG